MRKGHGHEAKLCYQGHVLMENRHGWRSTRCVTPATGIAEREAAVGDGRRRCGRRAPLGADKGYDTAASSRRSAALGVTPHVAQNTTHRAQCDRWPHHAPRRLRGEPAEAQAHRRDLRLAQDGRPAAQDAAPGRAAGRLDVHLRAARLQPGADPEPDRGGSDGMSGRRGGPGGPAGRGGMGSKARLNLLGVRLECCAFTRQPPIFRSLLEPTG